MENKEKVLDRASHCGVPQCNSYRQNGITMYKIPKEVLNSRFLLKKWSIVLRMGKSFPKFFKICSLHFKEGDILKPIARDNKRYCTRLVKGAFPSRNLPKLATENWTSNCARRILARCKTIENRRSTKEVNELLLADAEPLGRRRSDEEIELWDHAENPADDALIDESQQEQTTSNKGVQVDLNPFVNGYTALWDTDKKLSTMTGLEDFNTLNTLVKLSAKIRKEEKVLMPMRERILMTMYKLKSNSTFAELAISFQICERTAKLYFADTIQHLAALTKCFIYWQSKEQNVRSLPVCFKDFSNVKTVLDCTEMKTVTFQCLKCRTCTYSHYKGTQTLKVLIGVSPSGSINYISKVATGKSSDKAIFNLTEDLIKKLEPGDAVMVDKGFMIGDELSKAGIEMVRPAFNFEKLSKQDIERNTKIAAARVHVERRIARLKVFKVLSEKVGVAVVPYMDDIMTVLCALSNLSSPILSDEKFLK